MRITYFGHSCFLVEAQDHTRVIIDPYVPGSYDGAVKYAPVDEPADVVLASHDHPDHAGTDTISGDPQVFMHPVQEHVGSVDISGIMVDHDETGGSERGKSTIITVDDGDIRLVHLGDLGHVLDAPTVERLGTVDVLLVPVGGYFTVDSRVAAEVVESLRPSVVIPMHYKTPKIDFPIAPVDTFLETQNAVQHNPDPTIEVIKAELPADRTTVVLPYAR